MKFLEELKKVLSFDERFVGEANQFIKTKVSDAARANDGKLLKALLNNDLLKEAFFTKVDDIYVFDKNKFVWVLELKEFLQDSFTMYKNKIGLVDSNNNLISQKQDVSLVWPYKDCVLEGGQTKEDQKRDEIFYNETLAPDQVNRLIAPKVLGNAKRYTKEGIEKNIEFKEDDNLIIKGNNLLALSSLLKKYRNSIKCVYLDPPYFFEDSTDNDSFEYNSNFKLSTWLTFMKNRIEIAFDLMRDDGFLVIQMNDYGVFHLKVMLDELFKQKAKNGGFLNHISVKMSDLSGPKMAHVNKKIPKIKEHILIYQKDSTKSKINVLREPSDWDSAIDSKRYTQYVEKNGSDDTRNWEYTTVRKKLNDIGLTYGEPESYKFLLENADCVFRSAANNSLKKMSIDNNFDTNVFTHVKTETGLDKFVYKNEEVIFASSKLEEFNGKLLPSESISDIWLNFALNDLSNEGGGVNLKNGKKPESLLKRIILLTTQPNDIVLDFFMGTATTQAVALKLNRKFIGIEQMDYIKEKSIKRLVNVIKGEDRGISKSVNWKGGGSFVYCELLEDNENLVNELEDAKNSDAVKEILNKAIDNGKLIPSVLPRDLKENEDDFDKLSLDEQKNLVMELLNKNQLYVNLSDIDDEDYKVSEADKAFTRSFYGKE